MKSIMAVLALLTLLPGTASAEGRWVLHGPGQWVLEQSAPPNQEEINNKKLREYEEHRLQRKEAKIQKRRQEEAAAKLASQKRQRELDKSVREGERLMSEWEKQGREVERDQQRMMRNFQEADKIIRDSGAGPYGTQYQPGFR